ncbi:hypothetical protein CRUP_033049 [Coryphaenoides rupestris]|nr:hypothetical protein CRUP_033049 [Coryphaenoides rupestris]
MSVHFEERSGIIPCETSWGSWYQTMEEVFVEVNVPPGTSGMDVKCTLASRQMELYVKGKEIIKNPGFDFSGAEISGNFSGGGPDFSSLQK